MRSDSLSRSFSQLVTHLTLSKEILNKAHCKDQAAAACSTVYDWCCICDLSSAHASFTSTSIRSSLHDCVWFISAADAVTLHILQYRGGVLTYDSGAQWGWWFIDTFVQWKDFISCRKFYAVASVIYLKHLHFQRWASGHFMGETSSFLWAIWVRQFCPAGTIM